MDNKKNSRLVDFFSKYPVRKYKKGDLIYRQGEAAKTVGLTKSGYVRAFIENKEGEEMTLPILKPVFYTTLTSNIFEREMFYSLETMTDTEIWTAPGKDVVEFMKNNLDLHQVIMKHMILGFVELTAILQRINAGDAYRRVAIVLEFLFRNFGEAEDDRKQLDLSVPHRLIGTMTGLSRETVTLQILQMVKRGLIGTKNRRISLKNETKLKAAAGVD